MNKKEANKILEQRIKDYEPIKELRKFIPTSEIKKLEKNDVVDEIEDMANNVNYYVEAGKWGKASELARALSEYSYKCAKECESTDWAFSVMLKSTYSYWNLAANNYNYLAVLMTLRKNISRLCII